ncbi:MAG TPA: hypothetical protein PKX79_05740 [Spirochaetota bacterium]|nr:hypothetical protein [Spirochaetota bacterium]
MKTKKRLWNKNMKKTLFLLLLLLISCSSILKEPTCEEKCEYAKRDCLESARQDSINFSFFMRDHGRFVPYAWTKKCEEDAEKCKKTCNISDGK